MLILQVKVRVVTWHRGADRAGQDTTAPASRCRRTMFRSSACSALGSGSRISGSQSPALSPGTSGDQPSRPRETPTPLAWSSRTCGVGPNGPDECTGTVDQRPCGLPPRFAIEQPWTGVSESALVGTPIATKGPSSVMSIMEDPTPPKTGVAYRGRCLCRAGLPIAQCSSMRWYRPLRSRQTLLCQIRHWSGTWSYRVRGWPPDSSRSR
jgi:hypothetical protein